MLFRYRLFSPEGEPLGEAEYAVSTIAAGDTIRIGDGRRFAVDAVISVDDPESPFYALLEVRPLDA